MYIYSEPSILQTLENMVVLVVSYEYGSYKPVELDLKRSNCNYVNTIIS